ncbi:MAG: tRNA epoxyqueuosine(34) reductase QueG, partial [Prochlorotrichaceae cyanobacterium]
MTPPLSSSDLATLAASIKAQALEIGFDKVGITRVDRWRSETVTSDPTTLDPATPNPQTTSPLRTAEHHLQTWLDRGFQADLTWMESPKRQDIRQVMPGVKSVIAVAMNYYTPHAQPTEPDRGKISRYAWGRDYHRILQKRLKHLMGWIQQQQPEAEVRYYVDTGPLQDKVWAQRSGLGWIAKNSNVITRDYGSWVFLGLLLTTLDLPADPPFLTDHCGTCTRCLDACPTGAIVEPFVVDANRCIAYHTIENRSETLPDSIVPHLEGWVAGCDICQEVCPWNERFAKPTTIAEFEPYTGNVGPTLQDLSTLSEADWNHRFPASALRRIKPSMWRRNAQAILDQ